MTLWQGRIGGTSAPELWALSKSLHVDGRLALDDVRASEAHVRGLARAGVLSAEEAGSVLEALGEVRAELEGGTFRFAEGDEDIHTAIERRVTELAGEAGAKLHSGRSRNDQVVTDLRLWTRRELVGIRKLVLELAEALVERAEEVGPAYLPGYTHLQRAQAVLLAHHLGAHAWALERDLGRLADAGRRMDVSPLGAGALAGTSLPLDPAGTAADLGFTRAFENSLDAVSDRDFVAEALFALALLGVHLSRLGEELVLWSTEEFGFVVLPDELSTGSSMLPQKKNPDIAELARAKAGRLIGHVAGMLAVLKGLPLAYNRDLQEDKEPLFDAVDTCRLVLPALSALVREVTFDTDRMATAADGGTLGAVDLAEWLVERQMPFRRAHELIGSLVRESLARNVALSELVAARPELGDEAAGLLAPGVGVTRRRSPGGAGPGPVAVQLDRLRGALREARTALEAEEADLDKVSARPEP